MFKAIVFDIGRTLVTYNKPLNWEGLYKSALIQVSTKFGYNLLESDYDYAIEVLRKYNTRINPREHEVSSEHIFEEILCGINIPRADLEQVKHEFYSFFRREVTVYPEVGAVLKQLHEKGVLLGTLSDVPYGMDNRYVLEDISSIIQYIDYPITSNDVGYRKPSVHGLQYLAEKMKVSLSEMMFVGDEEKDMVCAKNAGAYAVLINRNGTSIKCIYDKEISSLQELL